MEGKAMEGKRNEAEGKPSYWKDKQPSMKRRCTQHDYRERGIYMITMVIEGRRPLLGRLAGDPEVVEGPGKPHVELSAFGRRVWECWRAIPEHHPAIEAVRLCIMPDHIHGVIFVKERMEKHLGQVIAGFKTGCNKAARELGIMAAAMPQPTGQEAAGQEAAAPGQAAAGQGAAAVPVGCVAAVPQRWGHYDRHHGALWEAGYHDRILREKGQLGRMLAYLDDNPRRLLLKRLHPEYFTCLGKLTVVGVEMEAMGNRFLLDYPAKKQVQCSRHLYDPEIEAEKEALLEQATREGAIVVSPCISRGEKVITTAAMQEHLPLIVLLLNGFPEQYKPDPRYLDACTEGRLLMLAPYPHQTGRLSDMRARCLELNRLAAAICKGS